MREFDRYGDPAFVITADEARDLAPNVLPNEFGDDGDVALLCDGVVLHGSIETGVFYDCTGEADWFMAERAMGLRPIIRPDQQHLLPKHVLKLAALTAEQAVEFVASTEGYARERLRARDLGLANSEHLKREVRYFDVYLVSEEAS